jgi:hypothetical protein
MLRTCWVHVFEFKQVSVFAETRQSRNVKVATEHNSRLRMIGQHPTDVYLVEKVLLVAFRASVEEEHFADPT